jgi:hypothetical protein
MTDKETYSTEAISIGDKMLNNCMDSGLGFTESISLSNLFIEDEVKRLNHLIDITPVNSHFLRLQAHQLEQASKYLTLKL